MSSTEVKNPLLSVSNVAHHFQGVRAVESVTFDVAQGSITGLIGPNGAGKSTVIDIISSMKKLQSGRVEFGGVDISKWSAHRIAQLGLMRTFQVSTGFAHLTALENMMVVADGDNLKLFPKWLFGIGAIKRWERPVVDTAMEILENFGLGDKAQTYAEELSGGQRRLLEIARLMMMNPRCILLDEPTAGVSPVMIDVIVDRIKQLRDKGITIVVVEHNLDVVERLCDDVLVLAEGKVLARGSLSEIRLIEEVVEAYLG